MAERTVSDGDVKDLALWMHAAMVKHAKANEAKKPGKPTPWNGLPPESQARYLAVARALLTDPPAMLRESVRQLEART
jgi:hypothetical protein